MTHTSRSARALAVTIVMTLCGALACRPPMATTAAPVTREESMRARLLRIEDTRRDEPAFLDSMLVDPDARVRAQAALAAGRLGSRRHVPRLRVGAADADTAVAANALFSLGLLKDSAAVPLAASALARAGGPATEAAWLLGEVAARDAIAAALRNATLARTTHGALLLAAARLRPVPADAVVPYLTGADSAVAWRAAYALARGRSTAGLRAMLGQAASPWDAVREHVARAAIRPLAGDSLGALARTSLATLVRDGSARVRVNAVRALGTWGPDERAPVLAALRDRDAGVRLSAAQALDAVLDSGAVAWEHAMTADTALVIQRIVAEGAAKRGVRLAAVAGWRASADWQRRAAYAELETRQSAEVAYGSIVAQLADPDGRVRAGAASALRSLRDSAAVRDRVRLVYRRLLTDADMAVRTTALSSLTRGASLDELAAALISASLAEQDESNDARLAFWALADSALARPHAALPDSVERMLASIARPADPLERVAASRIARFAAWKDSTGTARAVSWYEARARDAGGPAPVLVIETERGTMELLLLPNEAPLTVFNITSLARRGYFDGQRWHRVVPNFVVQGGDPRGDGNGGPGYAIRDELNRRRYLRGTVGMALSGPHTGGSQFFVTHSPQPHLDAGYTVFGQLLRGGEVLDAIVQGDRIVRVTVR